MVLVAAEAITDLHDKIIAAAESMPVAVDVPEPLASVIEQLEELGDAAPEYVTIRELAVGLDFDPG